MRELEDEITETQAAQIELDKTAEEFKRLHVERHQLYLQWSEAVQNSQKRDKILGEVAKDFGNHKQELKELGAQLEEAIDKLGKEKDNNKQTQQQLLTEERNI